MGKKCSLFIARTEALFPQDRVCSLHQDPPKDCIVYGIGQSLFLIEQAILGTSHVFVSRQFHSIVTGLLFSNLEKDKG